MAEEKDTPEEFPQFATAMIISAHPDDPDFGAAGTLARLVEGGA